MTPSTFGERFLFARIVQAMRGISETDGEFAEAVGVGSSSVTAYKTATEAPPASRVAVIAKRCHVDPGWLTFGEQSGAPSPLGFEDWLVRRRENNRSLRVAEEVPAEAFTPVARGTDPRQASAPQSPKKKRRRAGGKH